MVARQHTDQSGAAADGDIIGGDKIIHIHASGRRTTMHTLLERLREEKAANSTLSTIVAALQHYLISRDLDPTVGLPMKLQAGNREEYIEQAMEEKELFFKHLTKNQLYTSSQEIYAYLLGRVRDYFKADVAPKIAQGLPAVDVDSAVVTGVINPILAELDSNDLVLMSHHVRGMIYFLTGNCFLRWDGK